jgi:hypothetical protein
MSSEETVHASLTAVTPRSGKETLGAWWSLRQARARLDKTGYTKLVARDRDEAISKPVADGAYANQRLNFGATWEGSSTKDQGFKPDLRNSAVRHYRGASGNVMLVEM